MAQILDCELILRSEMKTRKFRTRHSPSVFLRTQRKTLTQKKIIKYCYKRRRQSPTTSQKKIELSDEHFHAVELSGTFHDSRMADCFELGRLDDTVMFDFCKVLSTCASHAFLYDA